MVFSSLLASPSWMRWLRACRLRSWAVSSEASLAALMAKVRGMERRDEANAPIASCSREPWRDEVLAMCHNIILTDNTHYCAGELLEVDM